jgi:hypothetical protein
MLLLMEGNGLLGFLIIVYLICHLPAIITLIIGLRRIKTRPKNAKKYLIFSGVYFLIGTGICGALLS